MEEFMNDVIKALKMKLGEGYRIFPKEQRKNNELVLYGICIHKENESVSPVVYLEEFILPYIMGVLNAEKIADILLEQCRQGKISQEAAAHLDDFKLMKDKVRIRLVNYGANSGELEGMPHRKFLDLAITYYLDMQAAIAGQNANLPPFLQAMKLMGTEAVYEAYDMDKLLKTACRGDYNEKCVHCENYRKYREGQEILCEKKSVKRQNIQRGCRKLAEICGELDLPAKALTWDTDEDGDWAEHVKGVDDYLHGLEQKNSKK